MNTELTVQQENKNLELSPSVEALLITQTELLVKLTETVKSIRVVFDNVVSQQSQMLTNINKMMDTVNLLASEIREDNLKYSSVD